MTVLATSDGSSDKGPRVVSRGLNLHPVFIGMDSLYVVLEYPFKDVFERWSAYVADNRNIRLRNGIPVDDDFVLRRGGNGYQLSLWSGDARLFMTDRVNETLVGTSSEGQGMGLMLQLGPEWLQRYGDLVSPTALIRNVFGQFATFGVRQPQDYAARLNRIDITIDVLGLSVAELLVDEWRRGWVGYSRRKGFYISPLDAELEGLAIGSSEGAVRFKVYDKVAESRKRGTSRFWRSVWGVGAFDDIAVARFEWSFRVYKAKFSNLHYLTDYSFDRFMELLNYGSERWGRLCVPDAGDSNRSRRELAPLWQELRRMIEDWTLNYKGRAKRDYDFRPDLNRSFLASLVGWIGSGMARLGIERGIDGPESLFETIAYLEENDFSIVRKAQEKWEIASRLVERGADNVE